MSALFLLSSEDALSGRDLSSALAHFRANRAAALAPEEMARFKKKEPLSSLPKSLLKHRLTTLTGRPASELEAELGYSIKAGRGMPVEDARKLAHFLILEANGVLNEGAHDDPVPAPAPVPSPSRKKTAPSSGRKRTLDLDAVADTSPSKRPRGASARRSLSALPAGDEGGDPLPPARPSARSARRSLAPEALASTSETARLTPVKRRKGAAAPAPKTPAPIEEEEEEEEEDDDMKLFNPTPQMIELKRKIAVANKRRSLAATPARAKGKAPPAPPADVSKKSLAPEKKVEVKDYGFEGAPVAEDDDTVRCRIYLACGDPSSSATLSLSSLRSAAPVFPGANLTMLHTPAEWGPPDVFSVVQAVRAVNKEAGLNSFLVLVGCGIPNVHMFREALLRQTSHVQFIVIEREDQNRNTKKGAADDGKLRETTSFFLLAYFFPGSEVVGSSLPERMVRSGATTCLRAESVEDLENAVVHTLSEGGDWVLDLCCRSRELSLAAQKTGRFAIAVEEDASLLEPLRKKAAAIEKGLARPAASPRGKRVAAPTPQGAIVQL